MVFLFFRKYFLKSKKLNFAIFLYFSQCLSGIRKKIHIFTLIIYKHRLKNFFLSEKKVTFLRFTCNYQYINMLTHRKTVKIYFWNFYKK